MRYVVIALTMFSFLALGGCDKLAKAFEDVQEEAPGICKKDCAEKIDCEWGGDDGPDLGGDKEDAARNRAEDSCVATCAWAINYGVFIVEHDDGDKDYVGTVSGAKYEKYLKCIFNYKDCNDDYWYVDLDWQSDEDDCEDYCTCQAILGNDFECEWDDDDGCVPEEEDIGIEVI